MTFHARKKKNLCLHQASVETMLKRVEKKNELITSRKKNELLTTMGKKNELLKRLEKKMNSLTVRKKNELLATLRKKIDCLHFFPVFWRKKKLNFNAYRSFFSLGFST